MTKNSLLESFGYYLDALEAHIGGSRAKLKGHPPSIGKNIEMVIVKFLRSYLPKRYTVAHSSFVIDSNGKKSNEIDILIFDNLYNPLFLNDGLYLDNAGTSYIVPAEAVYAVIEVKTVLNESALKDAVKKISSVRKLHRTSIPITHAGGIYEEKPLHEIISGVIAVESTNSIFQNLKSRLATLAKKSEKKIDCGWVLKSGSFDIFDGKLNVKKHYAIMHFPLRLLSQLQNIGSAPAGDWVQYAKSFESKSTKKP